MASKLMGHSETVSRQDIRVNAFYFHTTRRSSSPLNLVLRRFYCEKDVGKKCTLSQGCPNFLQRGARWCVKNVGGGELGGRSLH